MAEQLDLSNLSREELQEIIRHNQRQQSLSGQKDMVKVAASVVRKKSEKLEAEISEASQRATVVKSVDACFVLDCTGSMKSKIKAAKEKIVEIQRRIVGSLGHGGNVRFSVVGYRDHGDCKPFEILPLTKDVNHVERFLFELRADGGGGDVCEDVIGGLSHAMKLDWQARTRIIYLVCDAPPHGNRFKDPNANYPKYDKFPDSANQWETTDRIMAKSVALNLNFVLLEYANGSTDVLVLGKMFQVFSDLRNTSSTGTLQTLHFRPKNTADDFVQSILSSTKETLSKTLTRHMSNKSGARSGSSGSTLSLEVKADVCWKDCKNWPVHQVLVTTVNVIAVTSDTNPSRTIHRLHIRKEPFASGSMRLESGKCTFLSSKPSSQIVVGKVTPALLGDPSNLPWGIFTTLGGMPFPPPALMESRASSWRCGNEGIQIIGTWTHIAWLFWPSYLRIVECFISDLWSSLFLSWFYAFGGSLGLCFAFAFPERYTRKPATVSHPWPWQMWRPKPMPRCLQRSFPNDFQWRLYSFWTHGRLNCQGATLRSMELWNHLLMESSRSTPATMVSFPRKQNWPKHSVTSLGVTQQGKWWSQIFKALGRPFLQILRSIVSSTTSSAAAILARMAWINSSLGTAATTFAEVWSWKNRPSNSGLTPTLLQWSLAIPANFHPGFLPMDLLFASTAATLLHFAIRSTVTWWMSTRQWCAHHARRRWKRASRQLDASVASSLSRIPCTTSAWRALQFRPCADHVSRVRSGNSLIKAPTFHQEAWKDADPLMQAGHWFEWLKSKNPSWLTPGHASSVGAFNHQNIANFETRMMDLRDAKLRKVLPALVLHVVVHVWPTACALKQKTESVQSVLHHSPGRSTTESCSSWAFFNHSRLRSTATGLWHHGAVSQPAE